MTRPPLDRAATTRLLTTVATLYLIFVFYGSWVPLHFTYRPLAVAWQSFSALPFLDQRIASATDWATNFLLLIPLTFLWSQRLLPHRQGTTRLAGRLAIVGLGIALAFTLEFSQLYFPPRTVSQKDILALSLGALVGVVLQYRWGAVVENWLGMLWQHESHQARVIRLLHVYLLVLFVFSVLPLDLTLSVVEVYHKWREGRVVLMPFAGLKGGLFDRTYETVTDVLIWVPVGLFWALDRKSSLLKIAAIGWLAGAAIELAQLFVYSRVTDVTDILLAGVGTVAGGWLAGKGRDSRFKLSDVPAGFWFFLWAVWMVTIFAMFWSPYDFRLAGASFDKVWDTISRPPFLMLYQQSEFMAINEILQKIFFFVPGGILLGLGLAAQPARIPSSASKHAGTRAFMTLLAVSVTSEAGKFFLPGRSADLTDVILEAGGGLLGLTIVRWVLGGIHTETVPQKPFTAYAAATTVVQHRHTMPATRTNWWPHLLTFIALALGATVATRLPFVPYNLRELNAPGVAGLFSSIGLALLVYWVANGHFFFVHWAGQTRLLALPAWLIVHALIAWLIIRTALPLESVHDIVGAPVLDWVGKEGELLGRYVALHAALALQMVGASLFVLLVCRRGRIADLLVWITYCVLLAWPLHQIIVVGAATDNLTELMRNGGSFAASALLATGFFALFVTGTAIAAFFAFGEQRGKALLLAAAGTVVAAVAFWFGAEQAIVKYGKVFSAWQFLLSTNRQSYAHGVDLLLRYFAAYFVVANTLGGLQATHLKTFARKVSR